MKKILFSVLAASTMLFTACQSDEEMNFATSGGDGNVTINLSVPDAMALTRAGVKAKAPYNAGVANSARGGITNVDMTKYDIRYKIAVYRVDGENQFTQVVAPQVYTLDYYQEKSLSFRLTPNRNYKFVVWGDFVEQGSQADLHYNTADLTNITCLDSLDAQLNDESRDAYFVTRDVRIGDEGADLRLVLKRPFAKVRVVTTDWDKEFNNEMPDNFKITYHGCKRFTGMNAVTGRAASISLADDEATTYTGKINKNEKEYVLNYDLSDFNRTLTVDYLMIDYTDTTNVDGHTGQETIHLNFQAFDGDKLVSEHDFKTNIPVERNYLTTILGNLLTTCSNITISIDENFTNEFVYADPWFAPQGVNPTEPMLQDNTYYINTRDEFAWLAIHPKEINGKNIELNADIDMNGISWLPIGFSATNQGATIKGFDGNEFTLPDVRNAYIVFNGNNHTLRNFKIDQGNAIYHKGDSYVEVAYGVFGNLGNKNMSGKSVIKNVTFENITINGLVGDTQDGEGAHEKTAYFCGAIADICGTVENVTAKHVFVKGNINKNPNEKYHGDPIYNTNNVGGLLGFLRGGTVKNCSSEDVHLVGYQAAGLIGAMSNGDVSNSKSDKVYIRLITEEEGDDMDKMREDWSSGPFIGGYTGQGDATISDCTLPTTFQVHSDINGKEFNKYRDAVKNMHFVLGWTHDKDGVYHITIDGKTYSKGEY